MSPRLEQIDTRVAPEATLRAMHELYLVLDGEYYPGNPETPWPQRLVDWRYFDDEHDIPRWIIWEGDRVVASAGCFLHRTQDLDNSFGFFYVSPEYRGSGLGRILAAPVLDYASGHNRSRFAVAIPVGFPSAALAKRAGMKDAYRERVSQLQIGDVDRELLDMWVKRAQERAADYEVLQFVSPIPEEFRERFVAVTEVMNTAPMEDFEEDPFHWTDDMLANAEAVEAKRSRTILTAVAVHKPTGVFAGYTNIVYQKLHPVMAYQWDTGVDPEHRNKGLGRWLKAVMMQEIVANYPAVDIVVTENADSNTPMLNINVEMGFKPYVEQILWQGELSAVRAALSVSRGDFP